MDYSYYNEHNFPTYRKNDLQVLIGDEIIDILKCSYESFQQYVEERKQFDKDFQFDEFDFFMNSYGCFLVKYKSGLEYSFAYNDASQSVCVNIEKSANYLDKDYLFQDKDILDARSIRGYDNCLYSDFFEKQIIKINVVTANSLLPHLTTRPCEYLLDFQFMDETHLFLGLVSREGNFNIIYNMALPYNMKVKYCIE